MSQLVNQYSLNQPGEPVDWSQREFNLLSAFAQLMPTSGSKIINDVTHHNHSILTYTNESIKLSALNTGISAIGNISASNNLYINATSYTNSLSATTISAGTSINAGTSIKSSSLSATTISAGTSINAGTSIIDSTSIKSSSLSATTISAGTSINAGTSIKSSSLSATTISAGTSITAGTDISAGNDIFTTKWTVQPVSSVSASGWVSSAVDISAAYKRIGKIVLYRLYISGTSNSSVNAHVHIPPSLSSSNINIRGDYPFIGTSEGATKVGRARYVIHAPDYLITFYYDATGSTFWTTSGTKIVTFDGWWELP